MSGSFYNIEKLGKDNYETWRVQMKMVLIHRGLWKFANGTEERPAGPAGANLLEAQATWDEKDGQALVDIVIGLTSSEIIHIKKCD